MLTKIKALLTGSLEETEKKLQQEYTVAGWIRTVRSQKKFTFIEVNDGSIFTNLQVIADEKIPDYESIIPELSTGSAVKISGILKKSPARGQKVELHAQKISLLGKCPADTYPLQKKGHSFDFLRTIAHLRPRTNTQRAAMKVRSAVSFAIHRFFQQRGFHYIHTPIIAASDCEGGGEMFKVTTLNLAKPPKTSSQTVDFKEDFFSIPAYLTVSGQLNAECLALALGDVYTFGPTFRAENSNTSRHLAEFWMVEPEMAFADLQDDIKTAEKFLKYIIENVFKTCGEELAFFEKFIDKNLIKRLQGVASSPFEIISYQEALQILESSGEKFEFPVEWGADLQSEHERYLTEKHFNKPVVVKDWPEKIKAFYMRQNEDNKTVAAMDVIVPKIGEIIGGSQREERLHMLEAKIARCGLKKEDYWWYLDLRRFGSVPHSGFGLGLERLLCFLTGLENIRDVIPFPRYPRHLAF